MRVIKLGETPSLLRQYAAEMRDKQVQQDAMRFRMNAVRMGEIMAYEVSKTLPFVEKRIDTPLGSARVSTLADRPVIGSVLRAGLPMHQGFLNFFDRADSAFVSAFRKSNRSRKIEVDLAYAASPDLSGRDVLLVDPMLATGQSLLHVHGVLAAHGTPRSLHIAVIIASEKGVDTLAKYFKNDAEVTLWAVAVDPELNADNYIVPGLGDAGDLAFGNRA